MNDDRLLAGARTVHVRITLAPEDNASMNTSLSPVLVNAPFYSTTDMLAETSYKYFKPYLPPLMGKGSQDVDGWAAAWFTLKGLVVSGRQVPIGVLATYLSPRTAAPLQLQVHFSKAYPPEACPFRAASRSQQHLIFNPRHMYFNSLKEALSILTGKGQQVPFMVPDAWSAVWSAARSGNLEQHHRSIHEGKHPLDTKPCKRSGQGDVQIPLRLMLCQTPQAGQGLRRERFYSRPATAERQNGSCTTLMDTLYHLCPFVFGPPVACELRTEGEEQQQVTLQCRCQLEVQSSYEPDAGQQSVVVQQTVQDQEAATDGPEAAPGEDVPGAPPESPAVPRTTGTGQEKSTHGGHARKSLGVFCPAKVVNGCLRDDVEVQVAGIRAQPPGDHGSLLHASLLALHELFHAPDLFLYVVVHVPESLAQVARHKSLA